MMNGFASFVVAFCSICIALGGLSILTPSGALASSVKYIFSLIFLCVLLSTAIGAIKFSPDFSALNIKSETDYEINDAVLRQVFEQALKKEGIEYERVIVSSKKSPDGNIYIEKVTVYSSEAFDTVNKAIGGSEDYEVVVISE